MPAQNIYRGSAPVEYAVAVDRYLAASRISDASRRVYRVALETWAWLLIEQTPPTGNARRGAPAPTLLLARLDGDQAAATVRRAMNSRALMIDDRTFARESSILRNAAHWWSTRGWIGPEAENAVKAYADGPATPDGPSITDRPAVHAPALHAPTADASAIHAPPVDTSTLDATALFALRVPLREQVLWRLVYESAAPIGQLLALDVSDIDLTARRVRPLAGPRQQDRISWGPATAEVLPLLTIGRTAGPVFRTERRAPARVPTADRCPYTGRARLSARRGAELFEQATQALDPAGHGWNLRDLRIAGKLAQARIGR